MLSLSPSCSTSFLSLHSPPFSLPMARSIFNKTLTLALSPSLTLSLRRQSSIANSTTTIIIATTTTSSTTESDSDSATVQKIEEAIHGIVVRRSAPEWLPFVPGSSYWVPPRQPGCYGVASLFDKLANDLTEEQLMALTTSRGWPSSAFFLINNNNNNETSSVEDEEN